MVAQALQHSFEYIIPFLGGFVCCQQVELAIIWKIEVFLEALEVQHIQHHYTKEPCLSFHMKMQWWQDLVGFISDYYHFQVHWFPWPFVSIGNGMYVLTVSAVPLIGGLLFFFLVVPLVENFSLFC